MSAAPQTFEPVCHLEAIPLDGGVAALVEGRAIAVFRTSDGNVYATSNHDPCSGTSVLSRGIVGSRGEVTYVASPMHKQAFDLRTGVCLDDDTVGVSTFEVRIVDGTIWVATAATQEKGMA